MKKIVVLLFLLFTKELGIIKNAQFLLLKSNLKPSQKRFNSNAGYTDTGQL